jgi:hypothetical protein
MNTIVIGEPKICIVKGGECKRIYRDGEFQEICEKKNISEGKSPYRIRLSSLEVYMNYFLSSLSPESDIFPCYL